MAKKIKSTVSDFDLDTELDFGNFDLGEIDGKIDRSAQKDPRKPIKSAFKSAISGAKTRAASGAMVGKFMRGALPKEYGEILDRTGDVKGEVAGLYNDAIKDIKPHLQKLTREADKLVPAEYKRTKGYLDKLKKLLGADGVPVSSRSNNQERESALQSQLAGVFGLQAEQQQKQHAQQTVEQRIQTSIEAKRFKSSFGLLNSINGNLTKLSNYNERINNAFQKKSLELQYRSFFVQQEMLDTTKKFFEIFKVQQDAITRNTALPDYAKLQSSEFFKGLARKKFAEGASSLFTSSEFFKRGVEKMKIAAKDRLKSAGDAFGNAAMGLEEVNSGREQMQAMNELNQMIGADEETAYTMAGNAAGSAGVDKLAEILGTMVRKRLSPKLISTIVMGSKYAKNLPGAIAKLRKNKHLQFSFDDEAAGGVGRAKNKGRDYFARFLDFFTSAGIDTKMDTGPGLNGMADQALFDTRTQKSITTVIPGYLARIFRELQVIRTGNQNIEITQFDHKTNRFTSKTKLAASLTKSLTTGIQKGGYRKKLDAVYNDITKGKTLSPEAEAALRARLHDMSFGQTGGDADDLRHANFTKGLNKKVATEIQSVIHVNYNPADDDYRQKDADIANKISDARDSISNVRGEIQAMVNAGYGDALRAAGIAKLGPEGLSIDLKTYKKLALSGELDKKIEQHVKRSNRAAPRAMGPAASRRTLAAASQQRPATAASSASVTPASRPTLGMSHYGPFSSASVTHLSIPYGGFQTPSAQSSPTSDAAVSLLSGIKNDTAAIVERLDGIGRLGFGIPKLDRVGMRKRLGRVRNTAKEKQDNVAESTGGFDLHGFGDFAAASGSRLSDRVAQLGSPDTKSMSGALRNLAVSAGTIISKTFETVSNKLFEGGKTINDRAIQPGKEKAKALYEAHKDGVVATGRELFDKGLGLVNTVFNRARTGLTDFIENKLPVGFNTLSKVVTYGKDKVLDLVDSLSDVYVKGRTSPALSAILMRAGAYYDQVSLSVIKRLGDIKGPVINAAGEVVLTLEDIQKGIFDKDGQPITSALKKLGNLAMGFGQEAIQRLRAAGKGLMKAGAGVGERLKQGVRGLLNVPTGLMGGSAVTGLLTQIRDVLNTRLPGKPQVFPEIAQGTPSSSNLSSRVGNYVDRAQSKAGSLWKDLKDRYNAAAGSETVTTTTGNVKRRFGRMRDMGTALLGHAKDRFSQFGRPHGTSEDSSLMGPHPELVGPVQPKPEREGGWRGLLAKHKEAAEQRRRDRVVAKADAGPRYKSGKNILDTIMDKAGSAYDAIKGGLGTLGEVVGAGASTGRRGLLRRGLGLAASGAGLLGRGALGAGRLALGGIGALGFSGMATAASTAGMLGGSFGTLAIGALGSLATALAYPVVLGGAAALMGYGLYKGKQFLTRNEASDKTKIRLLQYGLNDSMKSNYHLIFALESLLEGKTLLYKEGQAALNAKKIDTEEILNLFDIDRGDAEFSQRFIEWFQNRFKPVFLTHETALYAADNKAHLGDIDKLNLGAFDKYIKAASVTPNVYGCTTSPFKDTPILSTTSRDVSEAVNALRDSYKDKLDKNGKEKVSLLGKVFNALSRNATLDKASKEGGLKGAIATILKYVPFVPAAMNLSEAIYRDTVGSVKLMASGMRKLSRFLNRTVTALETVRFKTYGLTKMDHSKVSALRALEDAMLPTTSIKGAAAATFEGDLLGILAEVGSEFGISSIQDKNAPQWVKWFKERFLPTYLNFVGTGYQYTQKKDAGEIESALKPEQKYALALRISGTESVWDKFASPWNDGEDLCYNSEDCAPNLQFLKEQSKESALKEEAAKPKAQRTNLLAPLKQDPLPAIKKQAETALEKYSEGEKAVVRHSASESKTIMGGKVPEATGPLATPEAGDQYIKLGENVNLGGVNAELLKNFRRMAAEYGAQTGKSINVTSGSRTTAQQAALHRSDPSKAAKPGLSLHEFGLAIDVNSADLDALDKLGLMRKYGFTRPVGGEPWHMEPAGIQTNIAKARQDINYANQAVLASLGRGGGGVGADRGSAKGQRNTELALSLLDTSASSTVTAAASKQDAVKEALVPIKKPLEGTKVASNAPTPIGTSRQATGDNSQSIVAATTANDNHSNASVFKETEPGSLGKGSAGTSFSGNGDTKQTIADAAKAAGVDPTLMQAFAAVESGFNTGAKSSTSSASGLFQFTDDTWKEVISRYGRKYGLDASTSPNDPKANALMAGEYLKQNMKAIRGSRPNPNAVDAYMAHFLGASGASKFFRADPNALGATLLPDAAARNKPVFYGPDGNPRTVGEIYTYLSHKVQTAAKQYGINLPATSTTLNPTTSLATASTGSAPMATQAQPSALPTRAGTPRTARQDPRLQSTHTAIQLPSAGLAPTSPTLPGMTNSIQTQPYEQSKNARNLVDKSVTNIDTTLTKSLDIQTQILDALKGFLATVSPERMKEVTKGLNDVVTSMKTNAPNEPSGSKSASAPAPSSAVSLKRAF